MSETPQQGCVNQEYAETIKTHPESWKAWKREAERLQSFISHASNIEIACENPSVNDHMVHWEGRAIKAEAALSAAEQRAEAMGRDAARWRKARQILSVEDIELAERGMRETGSSATEAENIKADSAIDAIASGAGETI